LIGGVGKFTIRWDHGAELENLFNLSSGFYGVTIRDETSCEIRSEFNIVEPAQLQIEAKVTDALDCFNPQSGEIVIGIIGGTPPYSIQWSNGSTLEKLTGITSGQYAVTVKDASGCLINQNFDIKRPSPLNILSFRSTSIECSPRSVEEKFQITVTGGVAPYSIQWSGGKVSPDGKIMTTDSSGLYEVIVTDGKGCIKKESFEVNIPVVIPEAQIESTSFEQYNSFLVNFEIQFLNKSFGQITSYFWDFGDGSESFEENPKHTYSAQGEYEVTLKIKDVFGCISEIKKKIYVLDYYLFVPNVFTPNGDGLNDYYFPKFLFIESLEFWVLNKWGETIFYTADPNSQGWNGKVNQIEGMPGNYVYKLKFKTLDGRTQTQTDLFLLLK
jgi:gliding motility-associated-like protein